MSDLSFFDTNILVYCDDPSVPDKQAVALELFSRHQRGNTAVLSIQVLQEYFATVTRKLGVSAELAQRQVQILAQCRLIRFGEKDVLAAIQLHRLMRISFWDALIVHAAHAAGCRVLYTEDLQPNSQFHDERRTGGQPVPLNRVMWTHRAASTNASSRTFIATPPVCRMRSSRSSFTVRAASEPLDSVPR